MRDFKTLDVWQKSKHLAVSVYQITSSFPQTEIFGVTSQLRRAIISVSTNIAEGCGRGSDADMARFIQIAIGSLSESESLLYVSSEIGFISSESLEELIRKITETRRMLIALLKKLQQ